MKDYEDSIMNFYRNYVIRESDENLIRLVFSSNPNQEELDDFLKSWDIEEEGSIRALLLSYYMKDNPRLVFPTYVGPRLQGLIKYFRFRNLKLMSDFANLGRRYKECGADIMLINGGGMKVLRPDYSRNMNCIDVIVDSEHFDEVVKISKEAGYIACHERHSIVLHSADDCSNVISLHRYVPLSFFKTKECTEFTKTLFERSSSVNFCNVEVRVPSSEDMVFLIITSIARTLVRKFGIEGVLLYFSDLQFLLGSKTFNWKVVAGDIVDTKCYNLYLLGHKFINRIVPNLLPDFNDLVEIDDKINKKFRQYCVVQEYSIAYVIPFSEKRNALLWNKDKEFKLNCLRWWCRFLNIPVYLNSYLLASILLKLKRKRV